MTDDQLDELFADPRFRDRMFRFIKDNLLIETRANDVYGHYVDVKVTILGMAVPNVRASSTTLVKSS